MSASLSLQGMVEAGFSSGRKGIKRIKIGPGSSSAKLDKSFFKKIGKKSMERMLQNPAYKGKTEAELQNKAKFTQKGIVCAIQLIKKENRAMGEALERLYLTNGICIALAPKGYGVHAEIRPDRKAAFTGKEVINIYTLLCEDPSLTKFELFQLFDILSHEGLHGMQVIDFSPRPTVTQAKDIHRAEIEAHQGMVDRLKRMKKALEGILGDGKVPAGTKGAIKDFADAVAASPDAKAAKVFLDKVKKELATQMNVVEFRRIYHKAACLVLEGAVDVKPTFEQLKKYKSWFDFYKKQGREWGPIAPYFIATAPKLERKIGSRLPEVTGEPKFVMVSPETDTRKEVTVPGVDTVSDILIFGQGTDMPRLFVGGFDNTNDQAVIVSYDIDPGSGALADDTGHELVRTQMVVGFGMTESPSGDLFVLNRNTGAVCRGEDTNDDGSPDTLAPAGYLPVQPGTAFGVPQDFFFVSDTEIVGEYFGSSVAGLWGGTFATAELNPKTGDFGKGLISRYGLDEEFSPTITGLPYVGADSIEIAGTPGSDCKVWYRAPDEEPREAGAVRISWCGSNVVRLFEPIGSSDTILVTDIFEERSAEFFCVPQPTSLPKIGMNYIPGGPVQLRTETFPGDQVRFFESSGLDGEWTLHGSVESDSLGRAYVDVGLSSEARYLRCEGTDVVPLPVAAPDSFKIVPGIPDFFDVAANDPSVPPGTEFELTKAPDFPGSVFHWSRDGKIEVQLPTFAGPIEFEYRPVRRGKAGAPVRGVFELDSKEFVDPVPYDGPEGVPWVRVPVLVHIRDEIVGNLNYPMYQFTFAYSIFDECKVPHWHWRFGTPVYALEAPLVPVDDPDISNCGYGTVFEVPVDFLAVPQSVFKTFVQQHP